MFPVFSGHGERTRWRGEDWAPDLQEVVIEELGPLAVKAAWDANRQEKYRELRNARQQIASDAFQTTRMVLAMEQKLVPESQGVREIRVVAAYHDWNNEWKAVKGQPMGPDREALGRLGFAVSQKLLTPASEGNEPFRETLKQARDLSLKPSYRARRAKFFEWQESAIDAIARGRKDVDGATREMELLVNELNREIMDKWTRLGVRTACSILKVVFPFVELAEVARKLAEAGIEAVGGAVELSESEHNRQCELAAMIVAAQNVAR